MGKRPGALEGVAAAALALGLFALGVAAFAAPASAGTATAGADPLTVVLVTSAPPEVAHELRRRLELNSSSRVRTLRRDAAGASARRASVEAPRASVERRRELAEGSRLLQGADVVWWYGEPRGALWDLVVAQRGRSRLGVVLVYRDADAEPGAGVGAVDRGDGPSKAGSAPTDGLANADGAPGAIASAAVGADGVAEAGRRCFERPGSYREPRELMERAMPGHGMRDLRPSLTGIPWRSAPKVGPRAVVAATFGACSGLVQAGGRAVDWSYPVADAVAEGTVLRVGPGYVAMGLDLLSESNGPLRRWGYFNYLLYAATHYAAGRPTKFFADWPASPVPHGTAKAVWLVIVALVWPVTLAAYFWARRAARRETQRSAGAATVRFFHTLTRSNPNAGGPGSAAWSKVGFERPLAGWWTLVASFVVVIIPYVLVVQFLLPTYVQKFPEAEGMGATVSEFFWWVWILFDLGTSTAFVKQFAELRVRNPQRALAAMQAYNWWQIFTGALQLTLIGLLGAYVVPHTRYALMAHLVAVAGVGQWPGVFGSIAYFFQATQRYDYYQTVDLLQNRLLVVVLPIPFILVGRAWGLHQLEYGEAYGAVLGMAAGGYAVSLTGLAISYLLLRRMGVGLRPLFLASFDRGTLGRLLAYGWKIAASGLPFRLANTFELGMLVALLLSYNESVGIKSFLETKLVFFFMFLYSWCEPAIAPFSEAHGAGKKVLVQYYIARYLQFGHLFVAALFSFLAAVGPLFVRSALDAQWAAAAVLVPLAAIRGLLLPSAWVGDMVQKGCGRPGMNAWLLVGEQLARLALFWLLIPRLQLVGVLLAVVGTLVLKAVVGWTLIHRWIVRVRVPLWSAVLAPLAAGGLNFGLWRILVELLSAGGLASLGRWGALGTMLAASVAALPSCLWLMGLLGGYDPKALGELVGAAEMAGALSPVARRLAAMARHGAALHDRVAGRLVGLGWARGAPGAFSQELVEGAEAEARQLELAEGQAVDSVAAGCGATVPAEVTSTGPASVAQEPHGASR